MEQKRPPLEAVLAWQHPDVVASFVKTFAVPLEVAQDIFEQTKTMLWLMNEMDFDGSHQEGHDFSLDHSLAVMDEMWHQFILYTRDYQTFCDTLFGRFRHHLPTGEQARQAYLANMASMSSEQRTQSIMDEKRWQYTYVYQKLGKPTFVKWYVTYHQHYTPRQLLQYRLQAIEAHEASIKSLGHSNEPSLQ